MRACKVYVHDTEAGILEETDNKDYLSTYSPTALKQLFDGLPVSHILDFDSPNNESADNEAYVKNVGRISLSGWSDQCQWRQ